MIEQVSQKIENNQLTHYQSIDYHYDAFGNLQQRRLANGEVQTYEYNAKDQLIRATIQKPNSPQTAWQYRYDVLGRRMEKASIENGEIQLNSKIEFIWDGSHLVQEIHPQTAKRYSYIYTHPNSYEPLAQLEFAKNSENPTACHYFHSDQIGIPRELTDKDGNLCWYGHTAWGKLKECVDLSEQKAVHQPFRLQNQYADEETGLHYNFFRYYEPNIGRFTQLDPIGLSGGENLYWFAGNAQKWVDPLGLARFCTRALSGFPINFDLDKDIRFGLDLGPFHEHIFFDDGTNIGYTTTGTFSESSSKGYKCSDKHYDDKIMKQAVMNVKKITTKNGKLRFGDDGYSVIKNNCQDFSTEVENEYLKIIRGKK